MSSSSPNMASDAVFSMLTKLLYLVTRLGLPPLILAHVTLTEYGLWSACFILIGYIGMADLGLSSVYVRHASRLHEQGDTAGIGRMLSTGIVLMLGLGVLLLGGIVLMLPQLMDLLKIDAANRATAETLVVGTSAIFLLDMSLSAYAYLLHGLQQFRAEQRTWVYAFTLELVLIVAFLFGGMGIRALLAAFALRYAFSIVANMRLAYRMLPGLTVGPRQFDRSLLPGFLGFGLGVQLSGFMAIGLHSADKLIAGLTLGPQSIALFDLGGKLPISAMSIPSAISQITLPAAARLSQIVRDPEQDPLVKLYVKATRSICLLAGVMLSFLAAFAAPLCQAWLGQRAGLEVLPLVMALTAFSSCLHITTGPGTSVFRGSGRLGNEFIYHGLRIGLLAASVGWVYFISGASVPAIALAMTGSISCAALLYMAHNHRALGLPLSHLATRVVLPGLLPFALGALLLLVWRALLPAALGRWPALALLALFGALHCALCGLALWRLLDAEERASLVALTRRLPRRVGGTA